MPEPVLVVVTWRDAFFEFDEGEYSEPVLQSTTGWELDRYDGYTTVAGERGNDGAYRALTHIPNDMVVSRIPVRESTPTVTLMTGGS